MLSPRQLTQKIRSGGSASLSRQTTHPTPGYTSPYLWPDALIEATRASWKSQTRSSSTNGATNAPEAPSTWTGMSSPVSASKASSASQISSTGSVLPSEGEARIATTPIVFSSQSFTASSADM